MGELQNQGPEHSYWGHCDGITAYYPVWALVCVVMALLLIQLPAQSLGEADKGPSIWAPA